MSLLSFVCSVLDYPVIMCIQVAVSAILHNSWHYCCSKLLTGPDSLCSSEASSVLPLAWELFCSSAAHQFICLYCMLLMESFYDEQFPVHLNCSYLTMHCLFMGISTNAKAVKTHSIQNIIMLFVNKVELSLR